MSWVNIMVFLTIGRYDMKQTIHKLELLFTRQSSLLFKEKGNIWLLSEILNCTYFDKIYSSFHFNVGSTIILYNSKSKNDMDIVLNVLSWFTCKKVAVDFKIILCFAI